MFASVTSPDESRRSLRLVLRRLGADDWFSETNRDRVWRLLREPAGEPS